MFVCDKKLCRQWQGEIDELPFANRPRSLSQVTTQSETPQSHTRASQPFSKLVYTYTIQHIPARTVRQGNSGLSMWLDCLLELQRRFPGMAEAELGTELLNPGF